jgi:hypothetical protein
MFGSHVNLAGVSSKISIGSDRGRKQLKVSLSTSPTSRRLIVELTGPPRDKANLHHRAGAGTNLVMSYDWCWGTLAGLFYRAGRRETGYFRVRDVAGQDIGKSQPLGPDVIAEAAPKSRRSNAKSPDPGQHSLTGVSSTILFNQSGSVGQIKGKHRHHAYHIGDLRIELVRLLAVASCCH